MDRKGEGGGKEGGDYDHTQTPCYLNHDLWTSGDGILTRFAGSKSVSAEEPPGDVLPLRARVILQRTEF